MTLVNNHAGRHAFETLDDDIATRQIIEQTIDFVKRANDAGVPGALRSRQAAVAAEIRRRPSIMRRRKHTRIS